jgi:membrane protein implicated in regulation of membrane protease activity
MDVLFWLAIILICAVIELHTHAMVAVFIALGAIFAGTASLLGASLLFASGLWILSAVILLAALRTEALKMLNRRLPKLHGSSGQSPMVGLRGLVTTELGDISHPGTITIRSEPWRAASDEPITVGTSVIVREVNGTTLLVEPAPTTTP